MAKYKVVGLPTTLPTPPSKTLRSENRATSNVEVEGRETVFTHKSNLDTPGVNNIPEFYKAAGPSHAEGGIPLNLPSGDKPGEGTSFVFSKKLKESDKNTLDFFGMNPKKKVSYADISSKWLDSMNQSKAILQDPDTDKITKATATKNLDNATLKLAALALKQEMSKGMPNGVSDIMKPYLDKLQIQPNDLFALPNQQVQEPMPQQKFGGDISIPHFTTGGALDFANMQQMVNDHMLPTMAIGGDLSKHYNQYFGEDPEKQKGYVDLYNKIDLLGTNNDFKDALFEEYKKTIADPRYVSDNYIKKLKPLTRDEVFDKFKQGQLRHLVLDAHGVDYSALPGNGKTPQEQHDAANALLTNFGVDDKLKIKSTDDIAHEQAAWIAFNRALHQKDYYENAKVKDALKPFAAPVKGVGDEYYNGLTGQKITKVDGVAGDTYLGQGTGLIQSADKVNPDANKDVNTAGMKPLDGNTVLDNPFGYRKIDADAMLGAFINKASIKKHQPWMAAPQIPMTQQGYVSPDALVQQANQGAHTAIEGTNAFANPTSAAANAMAINAQAYNQAAQAIGNAQIQNVGIFNQGNQMNTSIAQQNNAQAAGVQNSLFDKRTIGDQQYKNAIKQASAGILGIKIGARQAAQDTYNLNTMTPQYHIDPFTGLKVFTNPTPFNATSGAKEDGKDFNEFRKTLAPDISPELAFNLYAGIKSGKWDVIKDDSKPK